MKPEEQSLRGSTQLPLGLRLDDDALIENFHTSADNVLAAKAVASLHESGSEPLNYLHGGEGAGKSHLLQAGCRLALEHGMNAMYIPLADLHGYEPQEILDSTEQLDVIYVDDVHVAAGRADWEEALFHWFNRVKASNTRVLMAAICSPRELDLNLEDLRSRLAWTAVYRLATVDDEYRKEVIISRAHARGLTLAPAAAHYMVSRAERSMPALMSLLDQLDHASLAAQRELTVPFIRDTLGW